MNTDLKIVRLELIEEHNRITYNHTDVLMLMDLDQLVALRNIIEAEIKKRIFSKASQACSEF